MESTGDRIKKIRNALGLSQSEFGERIGVKKSAISGIETGRQSLASQMSHSVCREFHVSETWLETGEGEMFMKSDEFSLDEFLREHDADQLEIAIVKAYFELDPDLRRLVLQKFKANLERDQKTVEDLEEEYEKSIKRASGSAPGTDTTASNSTAENA